MKKYVKNNLPRISIILVSILIVSYILTLIFSGIKELVVLYPSNLIEPLNWYRFLTYSLYSGIIQDLIHNCIGIIITGFILENKIKKNDLIILILMSILVGGLSYAIVSNYDNNNIAIASAVMISWGYISGTIIIGLKHWRTLNLFEKFIIILSIISVFGIWNAHFGFFMGQLFVCIVTGLFILLKYWRHNGEVSVLVKELSEKLNE